MKDGGTQPWVEGDIKCSIKCQTALHLDYHIQRNHTDEGIAVKFQSEYKLAKFFTDKNITFSQDRMNEIQFKNCKQIEGGRSSARPDFFLLQRSVELEVLFFVCNDEFAHRQTKCEFQRMMNIATSLQQTSEFENKPIIFVRFNAHFFYIDEKYYDPPLTMAHELLLETIMSIKKEDILPGVNLVYVNYDRMDGELCIFKEDDDNDFISLFKNYVIKMV